MSKTTIGIKIADGSFYPIVERDSDKWKRLILTTVRDGQTSVQIDLYEGDDTAIESAKYIGSLIIENIAPAAAGESEIELEVGVENDGRLSAKAEDLSSGESQSLTVSLESLTEDSIYDIPEFELGDDFDSMSDLDSGFQEELPDETTAGYGKEDEEEYAESADEYAEPARRRPFLLAVFIILGIAAIAALAIFLFKLFEGPDVPPLQARRNTVMVAVAGNPSAPDEDAAGIVADAIAGAPADALVGQAGPVADAAARDGPAVAVEQAGVSPSTPDESTDGVWYRIRRGDTLWDISWNFYRTPWQYGKIAEENSIRNPDHIVAGTNIYIPKKE
ncbi:MAG: Hsp70 family protein [Spirochaetales bacterium]|nr:Hsp70 family protein [Spirochaetales bacterium]